MDTMLHLHGHETPNFLLKFLFKRLLLQPIRLTISSFNELDMSNLAKDADCLMADFKDKVPILAEVRASSPPCPESMATAPNNSYCPSSVVAATNHVQFCP